MSKNFFKVRAVGRRERVGWMLGCAGVQGKVQCLLKDAMQGVQFPTGLKDSNSPMDFRER